MKASTARAFICELTPFTPPPVQPIFEIPSEGTSAKELATMLEYTRDAGDPEKRRKAGKVSA